MLQSPKQGAYIKIKTLRGNTVSIIHTLLKEVYENATLDRSTVQWWHKHFRQGRVSIEDEDNLWSGHPSTVTDNTSNAIIATVFDKDWHVMVTRQGRKWNATNHSLSYFN